MQGFKNVKNMGGGYLAWIDHGFPVHGITSSSNQQQQQQQQQLEHTAQPRVSEMK
jgi:3-mercaptopyruvate sulfurtransferase SseA